MVDDFIQKRTVVADKDEPFSTLSNTGFSVPRASISRWFVGLPMSRKLFSRINKN